MTKDEAIEKLDDLRDEVYNEDSDGYTYAKAIDMAIESLSADKVEVVRCGDCRFLMPSGLCTVFADECIRPSVSDFCSHGQRRK